MIRPDPVHLVDKGQPRDMIAVGLAPDRFGLGFHAGHGIENRYRPIQDPKAPFHFHGEIHMPGGIDDIDPMILPDNRWSPPR